MKLLTIALSAFFTITSIPAQATDAGRFPHDWYVLPEDGQALNATPNEVDGTEHREGLIFRRGIPFVQKSLDRLYSASAGAFEEASELTGRREPPVNAPDDWVPWYLKEIIMDLGVSLQGTVGVVTAKGAVSAEVYWQKKAAEADLTANKAVESDESTTEASDLILSDDTTNEQLGIEIEKIVETVMATGRVKPEGRDTMRDGLTKTATQLREMMIDINAGNGSTWVVDAYRLDVSVGISGKVGTGVEVGGDVRLSFEWKKSSREVHRTAVTEDDDAGRANLRKLLTSVAFDLEQASDSVIGNSSFKLTKFRLGIGIFGTANFGVAKGSLEVKGYAFFKKVAQRDPNIPRIIDNSDIALVSGNESSQHLQFAKANNVKFDRLSSDGTDKIIYYMNRDRFRKGLVRAVNMSGIFIERAERTENRKWTVYKIKPAFALSLMGAFGVVTVGGEASLQMEYKR